ncbi:MAG TPA: hypothetical protein VGM62_02540 [Chthoniobacterales bacterium]|jgi:hypothetical protein
MALRAKVEKFRMTQIDYENTWLDSAWTGSRVKLKQSAESGISAAEYILRFYAVHDKFYKLAESPG